MIPLALKNKEFTEWWLPLCWRLLLLYLVWYWNREIVYSSVSCAGECFYKAGHETVFLYYCFWFRFYRIQCYIFFVSWFSRWVIYAACYRWLACLPTIETGFISSWSKSTAACLFCYCCNWRGCWWRLCFQPIHCWALNISLLRSGTLFLLLIGGLLFLNSKEDLLKAAADGRVDDDSDSGSA